MRSRLVRMLTLAPLVLLGFCVFAALGGVVVRALWNGLLPTLFGFRPIGFWQALGLLVLCRILFGGFGINGHGRTRPRRPLAERWQTMTPEERERFRKGVWGRLGFAPSGGEGGREEAQ